MLVQIVYENNAARRYAEYQKMVDKLPETKVIMGIFNRLMRPVNRVHQYEATSAKKRRALFEDVTRLNPDVIIVDGLRQKDLEFFFMDRGFDLIIGQRKEPGGYPPEYPVLVAGGRLQIPVLAYSMLDPSIG